MPCRGTWLGQQGSSEVAILTIKKMLGRGILPLGHGHFFEGCFI
jgi:hypothetical protein